MSSSCRKMPVRGKQGFLFHKRGNITLDTWLAVMHDSSSFAFLVHVRDMLSVWPTSETIVLCWVKGSWPNACLRPVHELMKANMLSVSDMVFLPDDHSARNG